jgi:hypothetical protein
MIMWQAFALPSINAEHLTRCPVCWRIIDCRLLSDVLDHEGQCGGVANDQDAGQA